MDAEHKLPEFNVSVPFILEYLPDWTLFLVSSTRISPPLWPFKPTFVTAVEQTDALNVNRIQTVFVHYVGTTDAPKRAV